MQAENIKTLSFGCRLNAMEADKIKNLLAPSVSCAIVVNTCAVTAEAERQSGQAVRRIARENPDAPIFVTGCAATLNPGLFESIPNTMVIHNHDKMRLEAYMDAIANLPCYNANGNAIVRMPHNAPNLSKRFVQVQNGCNHKCAYCVTRLLRGPSVSFEYSDILHDVQRSIDDGFGEIVLTGVDSASYARDGRLISDLCRDILRDAPGVQRLRLSSMDPASPEIFRLIDLIHSDARMMPHIHLSMQSGADAILRAMGRRHNAETVRKIAAAAGDVTFSWDIICGFPGESDELFNETMALVHETRPIRVHAFPFSPRPGTTAADMPNQVDRAISKQRVKIITDAAGQNLADFMRGAIGQTVQVLVEENNIARTPHDISVKLAGPAVPARTICMARLTGINDDCFVGEVL